MPRLAPVTRATRMRSVDVEDRLAGDAALDERADRVGRLAPADLEIDVRVQAAGGDEGAQAPQQRAGAVVVVELVEDVEAVEPRAGGADEERPRREPGGGGVAAGERDDDAV